MPITVTGKRGTRNPEIARGSTCTDKCVPTADGQRNVFPINAPGMGRFQLLNLGFLDYGLELRVWVVIAIIVSLTLTIILVTTLTII